MAQEPKKDEGVTKTAASTWTDHLGYVLAAIVFGGIGLMRGMNEPAEEIPLAPGLHTLLATDRGERVRVLARVEAVEGTTVKLSDGPYGAVATVPEDAARRLVPGTHAVLGCTLSKAGPDIELAC